MPHFLDRIYQRLFGKLKIRDNGQAPQAEARSHIVVQRQLSSRSRHVNLAVSRPTSSPKERATNRDALLNGFPRRHVPAEPAGFVECKIYYGSYQQLSPTQKQYYRWWRDRFWAGVALQATDTYLFVAAYESSVFCERLTDVVDEWERLWRAYPEARAFRGYCSAWIEDARAVMQSGAFDEISLALQNDRRFNAAIRAGIPPSIEDVTSIVRIWEVAKPAEIHRLRNTMQALRVAEAHDPILSAAKNSNPKARARYEATPFHGLQTVEHLQRLIGKEIVVPTWHDRPEVKKAAAQLLRRARAFWSSGNGSSQRGAAASEKKDNNLHFVEACGDERRVAIDRSAVAPSKDADALSTLRRTLDLVNDLHVLVLLVVVLHMSDVKPYVEGQITYSSEMRGVFARTCEKLGLPTGLGPFRGSFYVLSHVRQAPWSLEPDVALRDMKMNVVRARFTRELQQALLGSGPRGDLYRWICGKLASGAGVASADIVSALESATGVPPFTGSTS